MARDTNTPKTTPVIEGVCYATRPQLAALYRERYGADLSPRSLERWPLTWRYANMTAVASVQEFLAEAERRFNARPALRGGRSPQHAAERQAA